MVVSFKMNVLHLHLSDWSGVRFAVSEYPELTSGLNGQFYTLADAQTIVAYAKDRGVRVVPEVLLPRPCLLVFLIASQHSLNQLRLQQFITKLLHSFTQPR